MIGCLRQRPSGRARSTEAQVQARRRGRQADRRPSCRSPTATSPTWRWCWPRRAASSACSSSTSAGAGVTRETLQTLDPTRGVAKLTFTGAAAERLGAAGEGAGAGRGGARPRGGAAGLRAGRRRRPRRWRWPRTMRWSATPSAGRSAATRRSSTSWPTCTSRTSWPAPTPTTAPGRWTPARRSCRWRPPRPASPASEAYWYAAKENIQTHGGIGFTWEVDCHLFYRRSQQLGLVAGGAKAWKERLVAPARTPQRGLREDRRHGLQRHPRRSRLPRRGARLARGQRARRAPARATASATRTRHGLKAAKAWQAKKAAAGYACITWPKEWGGGGGADWQAQIFSQEEAKFADAAATRSTIGLGMCVPTIMTAGNEADKQRFVGPALRGEEIWCQLFSEPSGGSDVAAARTRAVRAATVRRLGHQRPEGLDLGRPLLRLRHPASPAPIPDVPKHKGLTMFWVDMKRPGVEVRPIHQMSGGVGLQRGLLHRRAREGQPAPRRGRRRLARLAGHADERAQRRSAAAPA